MNQATLIKALSHPEARIRLQAAQVIHMVEETAALPELAERYRAENDPAVKEAMFAAGRHLRECKQAGFDTLEAIFAYFKVNDEILNGDSAEEARLIKEVENQARIQILKEQQQAQNQRIATNAGLIAGAALAGGISGALMAGTTLAGMPMTDVLSSNIGTSPTETRERTPATAPTNSECKMQIRRLQEDPDAHKRRNAAIDLANLNNPAALPYLAQAFLTDADADVRTIAQRAGKQIYWNGIYWEISHNSILDKEIHRRREDLRRRIQEAGIQLPPAPDTAAAPAKTTQEQVAAAASPEEIEDILRKAEERRMKRGKSV